MPVFLREANARGHADHGWLNSYHTFSFADYHDERFMGFGPLRVINEDRVAPGGGFDTHPHRDMEIISYVVAGALEHKDSLGTGSVIRPGDVQSMSAGTGVRHSEFNHSKSEPVHFLQIWIMPDKRGHQPRYDQKTFADSEKRGALRLVASGDGRDGSLAINQDANVFATLLSKGEAIARDIGSGRAVWVQVVRGAADINGQTAKAGDGVAIWEEGALSIAAAADSEMLVFDLP